MDEDLRKLPKELQKAYEKVQDRPDENTPEFVMTFLDNNENLTNNFKVNEIVDWVDPKLLDLELDDEKEHEFCYHKFATKAVLKVISFADPKDKTKNKSLEFYENNESIKRLKTREFTTLGDMEGKTRLEQADILAGFYGVRDDKSYKKLTDWEKELFAAKAMNREETSLEKK